MSAHEELELIRSTCEKQVDALLRLLRQQYRRLKEVVADLEKTYNSTGRVDDLVAWHAADLALNYIRIKFCEWKLSKLPEQN